MLLGFALYGLEAGCGWSLLSAPSEAGSVWTLAFVLLGVYGLGIGRAWELLGAHH